MIVSIIKNYNGAAPLSAFLKKHFNSNRQMGARDRRQAAQFVYNYYRLRNAFSGSEPERVVALSNFICSDTPSPLLQYCMQQHGLDAASLQLTIEEKLSLVEARYPEFRFENNFPFKARVSERINREMYLKSFLVQPQLYIRVRSAYRQQVLQELDQNGIGYEVHPSGAIALPNKTSLEKLSSFQSGYFEIQDIASQHCCSLFAPQKGEAWWDACAASGGKSLALLDKEPAVGLTLSDVRPSILENLQKRFSKTGNKGFEVLQLDLSKDYVHAFGDRAFDGIIADVPCSGSGTWARTPERITAFSEPEIEHYQSLQQSILRNTVPFLKPGKMLYYFTCSVFTDENETVAAFIQSALGLELIRDTYFQFSAEGGDTMYAAVFKKSS